MELSPSRLIAELGVAKVAEATGKRAATVRMWKCRDAIPRAAWPEITKQFPLVTTDVLLKAESLTPPGSEAA